MKLCMIGLGWCRDRPGGLNRYVDGLTGALARVSPETEVHVVVLGPATGVPVGVSVAGDEGDPFHRRLRAVRRAVPAESELIDAHFPLYALAALAGVRMCPLVMHFHGPWADESLAAGTSGRLSALLKRRLERAVYRRARETVVLSHAFKRLLVERNGVSPWHTHVVPPGVDLGRFSPGPRAGARARLGLPQDAWIVAAVRRLVPRMGIDVLLEAWAGAAGTGDLLLVGGEGPERSRLESRARELDSVRFLGHVEEDALADLYRASDLTVVPSTALEGFGLVALESLACGTPVLVSDAGGLPETVAGLDPGLVVPAGDARALADGLRAARARPPASAERCRAHAERFRWDDAAPRHLEIYERALGRGAAKPRLRVVYLGHSAQLSGAELMLLRLLPALGDEVDAHVILGEDGPLAGRLTRAGISVEVLEMAERARSARRDRIGPQAIPGAAVYTLRLARRLRQLRPDLVHANSLKADLVGSVAARLAGRPLVWHAHEPLWETGPGARLARALARRGPAAVVANSAFTLGTLGDVENCHVVPCPVVPGPELHRNGGTFRIGMVGRIAPSKGQHVFVEAFARAFPDGSEEAIVIGAPLFGADEEGYLADVRRRGKELGLDGRLVFAGFRERVDDELTRLDVLVQASTAPEGFGQALLEGMAAGLPVVASAAGALEELVDDGVDGLLCPPGDVVALARALRTLADEPDLRLRLGAAARAKAAAFTPEAVASQLLDVYREVLA